MRTIRKNLPVPLVKNSLESLGRASDPHCHEWQHGTHIDSLPREQPQDYSSQDYSLDRWRLKVRGK
jgi:hypothetical protein